MPSFTEISRWLHIVVATLAVLSQNHFQSIFQKLDAKEIYLLGPILVAIIGMQAADKLAAAAIDRLRWLRRLLSGQDDIEGDWVNIVIDEANPKEVIAAEYCRIRYKKGQYIISGDTWTLSGKWVHDFSSGSSRYRGRKFEYYYKQGIMRVGGYGVINFNPQDSLPSEFSCRYVDEKTQTPHVTIGRRLDWKLRKVEKERRRDAALEFAESFEANGFFDVGTLAK